MRMERCQTSRCSDLYDRYIPGYMAPSTSSSSESRDNRQPQIMSTQLSNNVGDNQIEKFITAAHGGDIKTRLGILLFPLFKIGLWKNKRVSIWN